MKVKMKRKTKNERNKSRKRWEQGPGTKEQQKNPEGN